MKKLVLSIALLVMVALVASVSCSAAGKSLSFAMDLVGPSISATATSAVLDSGDTLSKLVYYSGSTTVSATDSNAYLTGNYNGKVWLFEESTDNVAWTSIATLIGSTSAPAYGNSFSMDTSPGPYITTARYFRLSYDATLSSTAPASASGSGSLAIVPEPSGLAVLATSAVGLLGFIKRRR